jgi:4-hydroxybenzoate polyprenyltransferase/phosphoserine phosphatase
MTAGLKSTGVVKHLPLFKDVGIFWTTTWQNNCPKSAHKRGCESIRHGSFTSPRCSSYGAVKRLESVCLVGVDGSCKMTQNWHVEAESNRIESSPETTPLVVDLDGTLLRTDLLLESILRLVRQRPWLALLMPLWLLRGRAYLKRRISRLVKLDVLLLPRHETLLSWLTEEKTRGRQLVLATASDYEQALSVAEPLGLFDTVLGSDGQKNLKGRSKLETIVEVCGENFDYVGNSTADLEIWRNCRHAILVNASGRVERSAQRGGNVTRVFPPSLSGFRDALQSMRLYQWVKNLLLFVPAITSHTIFDGSVAGKATLAFFSFGFAASAAYILNDLLDLEEDRSHAIKKQRPFASGRMFVGSGIVLAVACLSASALIASWVPRAFVTGLITYLLLTTFYSLFLKRFLVIDVLVLASLYTLRVVAGSLATGIVLSLWLLSFAFFLFLSLAFVKRAADLVQHQQANRKVVPGRAYVTTDLDAVSIAGICSGFLSSLVLTLYINSESVQLLYRQPVLLWGLQPILLYYLTRLWLICRRGELTEDPIQYTASEPSTYVAAFLAIVVLLAATFDFASLKP